MSRQGLLYFRIAVPNSLQSLLNKRELRRSLGTAKLREARTMAMRLAVAAQEYFFLAERCLVRDGHFPSPSVNQHTDITIDKLKSTGTFLLEKALKPGGLVPHLLEPATSPETEDAPSTASPSAEKSVPADEPDPIVATASSASVVVRRRVRTMTPQPKSTETSPTRIPTVRQAAEAYIGAKTLTWSRASLKDIPPQIRQFTAIVSELEHGRDIPISSLSRDHIRRYYDVIRHLPYRVNGSQGRQKKSWLALADLGRGGHTERLLGPILFI